MSSTNFTFDFYMNCKSSFAACIHNPVLYRIRLVYCTDALFVFVWTFVEVVSSKIHPSSIPGVRISSSKLFNALNEHNLPLTALIHKQYVTVSKLLMRSPRPATKEPYFWVVKIYHWKEALGNKQVWKVTISHSLWKVI